MCGHIPMIPTYLYHKNIRNIVQIQLFGILATHILDVKHFIVTLICIPGHHDCPTSHSFHIHNCTTKTWGGVQSHISFVLPPSAVKCHAIHFFPSP